MPGRDGALRRPRPRFPAFGGPEIPLANTGKAPAETSQRDVPTSASTLAAPLLPVTGE
jgi:hypothetical protein